MKLRYCMTCHLFKPDRSHHCAISNRWILGMDHYCIWSNTSIGYFNRKYFILVVFYSIPLCMLVAAILYPQARVYIDTMYYKYTYEWESCLVVAEFVFFVLLSFALLLFLRSHISNILQNKTMVERSYPEIYEPKFDLGAKKNWRAVFGKKNWFLPLKPKLEITRSSVEMSISPNLFSTWDDL